MNAFVGQKVTRDATTNDSDKLFTVPATKAWNLSWLRVSLVTTATVGNRQMVVEIQNSGSVVVLDLVAGAVQAASLTRQYDYLQGVARETSFVGNELQVQLPKDLVLLPDYKLRVYDSAAVDAAADDMTVSFGYQELPYTPDGRTYAV